MAIDGQTAISFAPHASTRSLANNRMMYGMQSVVALVLEVGSSKSAPLSLPIYFPTPLRPSINLFRLFGTINHLFGTINASNP